MSEPTYTPPLAGLPPVTVEIARPVDSPPLDPAELERWLLSDLAAHPRGPRMNEREPTPPDYVRAILEWQPRTVTFDTLTPGVYRGGECAQGKTAITIRPGAGLDRMRELADKLSRPSMWQGPNLPPWRKPPPGWVAEPVDYSALELAVFAHMRPRMAHWDRAALDRLSNLELARLRVSVKHSVFCSPFPADHARWVELADYCRERAALASAVDDVPAGTPAARCAALREQSWAALMERRHRVSWTPMPWHAWDLTSPATFPEHRPRAVSGLGLIGRMVATLGAWLVCGRPTLADLMRRQVSETVEALQALLPFRDPLDRNRARMERWPFGLDTRWAR